MLSSTNKSGGFGLATPVGSCSSSLMGGIIIIYAPQQEPVRTGTDARAGATSQRPKPPHAMWAGTVGTGTDARAGATRQRPEPPHAM